MVSLKRVNDFLLKEEINPDDVEHDYNVRQYFYFTVYLFLLSTEGVDCVIEGIKSRDNFYTNYSRW